MKLFGLILFLSFSSAANAGLICKTGALRGRASSADSESTGPFSIRIDWRQNPATSEQDPYLQIEGRYRTYLRKHRFGMLNKSGFAHHVWVKDAQGRSVSNINGGFDWDEAAGFEALYYTISLNSDSTRGHIRVDNFAKSSWEGSIRCQQEAI